MNIIHGDTIPDPATAPELYEGVLTRRVIAHIIDVVVLSVLISIVVLVGGVAGFLTFGLAWLALPVIIPLVILVYYALTLGGPMRATIGMSLLDLVLVPTRGQSLDGWRILIHPIVFWITVWIAWPISLIVAWFTPRRQMVQDLVAGTLMLRRSQLSASRSSFAA
jgi:uncharacterized RDD family membrane protein YckC